MTFYAIWVNCFICERVYLHAEFFVREETDITYKERSAFISNEDGD